MHGSKSYRVPGLFDNEAVEVARHFTEWKSRLMPSLFDAAQQAVEHGTPMLRAMLLEFPDAAGRISSRVKPLRAAGGCASVTAL
ncbi:hypothetical protein PT2222_150304 [Paraburkholderia tropica]